MSRPNAGRFCVRARDLQAAGLGMTVGLSAISTASVAAALPDVVDHFEVSYRFGAWVMTAYAISLSVSAVVYGRVCRRLGVRTALIVGVLIMALGSVAAAAAPTFAAVVASRFVQGAGAGAAPVLAVTALQSTYREAARSAALAKAAGASAAVTAVGPLAGGLLTTTVGWRAAMLPPILALLVLPFLWRSLPAVRDEVSADQAGATLTALAATSLVVFVQSPTLGARYTWWALAVAVLTLPLLAWRVRREPDGFLPSAIVSKGAIVRVSLTTAALPAAWFGMLTAVPAALAWRGWSAAEIGVALLPGGLLALVLSGATGRVVNRVGPYRALLTANVVCGVAVLLGAVGSAHSAVLMTVAVVFVYAGFALGQPSMGAMVAEAAPDGYEAQALGFATLVFFIGGGLGAAIAAQGTPPQLAGALTALGVVILVAALPARGLHRRSAAPARETAS